METRRTFSAIFLGLALLLGYMALTNYLNAKYPPPTLPKPTAVAKNPTTLPTTQESTTQPAGPGPTGTAAAGTAIPSTTPAVSGGLSATSSEHKTALLGSVTANDPNYVIGVELTSRGASVASVTLNKFKKAVEKPDRYVYQQASGGGGGETGGGANVLSTRKLVVDGTPVDLGSVDWKLESATDAVAVFSTELSRDGRPVLRVSKTYRLSPSSDASAGYEVRVEQRFRSLTGSPVSVSTEVAGPVGTPWEIQAGPERQVMAGFLNQRSKQLVLKHHYVDEFKADKATIDLTTDSDDPTRPLSWVASGGAYFIATLRPESIDPAASDAAGYLESVRAVCLNPAVADSHLRDVSLLLTTKSLVAPPDGDGLVLPMRAYFGPKQRAVLDSSYYGSYPLDYSQTLVTTSWLCAFCTWQWLIRVLVWMLNLFHSVTLDWGIAIILLVVVVRGLLHPVTRRAQENMAKMQKLQPELERIKKKYGDDKEGLNKAMMDFYKEQGATPVMGCLPMFLQMPIWLALFSGLQSTFELRHQPFLYGLTWISDLSKPDSLITFPTVSIPLFCFTAHVNGIHVLPLIYAGVAFLQFKLTPKPPPSTPEQEQQQKMMQWMTLLIPFMFYNGPSGLCLYFITSGTLAMLENRYIQKQIKRKQEAEGEGMVVTGDVSDGDRGGKVKASVKRVEKKKGGWLAKLEELQEKAEEIRRQQEKDRKRK